MLFNTIFSVISTKIMKKRVISLSYITYNVISLKLSIPQPSRIKPDTIKENEYNYTQLETSVICKKVNASHLVDIIIKERKIGKET